MKTALLFGAQGTQWPGMGKDLLRQEPAFAAAIAECEEALRPRADWSLSSELRAPRASYRAHRDAALIQPALTSLQIALVALLRSRGIEPQGAAALSMGEAAAAWCCGAVSLADALEVAWQTALLSRESLPPGRMGYLRTGWERAGDLVRPWAAGVARAVELGRELTVISGDAAGVEHVLRSAAARGIAGGRLPLAQAYHSPAVRGIGGRFREGLRGLRPRATRIPLYSSAHGGLQPGEASTAEHWWRICSRPSLFYTIARRLLQDGYRRFVEVGPHPMLAESVREAACEAALSVEIVALMSREDGGAPARVALRRMARDVRVA